jgi:hypothetical protein
MRTIQTLLAGAVLAAALWTPGEAAAQGKLSKYTADYYRAKSSEFEGQEIKLKVSHVKPFHFKSAIPDLRFFHAFTYDKKDNVYGGWIVVAVPAGEASAFVEEFGTHPDGSGPRDRAKPKTEYLTGTFRADAKRLWFVDYKGLCKELLDARRQEFMLDPAGPGDPDTKEGMRPRRGGHGPG